MDVVRSPFNRAFRSIATVATWHKLPNPLKPDLLSLNAALPRRQRPFEERRAEIWSGRRSPGCILAAAPPLLSACEKWVSLGSNWQSSVVSSSTRDIVFERPFFELSVRAMLVPADLLRSPSSMHESIELPSNLLSSIRWRHLAPRKRARMASSPRGNESSLCSMTNRPEMTVPPFDASVASPASTKRVGTYPRNRWFDEAFLRWQ
jgi:hypothetical protein